MKVPRNYKEIIESSVQGKWTLLVTRTKAPPLPVLFKFFPFSSKYAERLYGVSVPAVVSWENGVGKFYLQNKQYKESIANITCVLFNPIKAHRHINAVLDLCRRTTALAKFFNKKNLSKYASKLLLQRYQQLTDSYALTFTHGYITWCVQVLQKEGLRLLSRHADALTRLRLDPHSAFGILVVSKQKSVYTKKEEVLEKLAKKFQSALKETPQQDPETVRRTFPALHGAISRFIRAYGWVGYDYEGPVMGYREVLQIIVDWQPHNGGKKISKGEILKACVFTAAEREVFKIFSLISLTKDERNACDDFVHYSLDNFYAEVGARINLPKDQVRYLWPNELTGALLREASFDGDYIKKKFAFCYSHITNGQAVYGVGLEAKKSLVLLLEEDTAWMAGAAIRELRGMPASPGKVTGIVRLVPSYDEVDKVKNGDILVTAMTSLRFMAGIHRAGALITDEGGLTSHAAIIARELKKPCIVGTKIATKVLKDGMTVEVNANNGVVKVIKKV